MADLLQSGVAWLAGQLRAFASETITYTQPFPGVPFATQPTVTVQATLGKSLLKLSDEFDVRIERTDADFLIVFADLVTAFAKIGYAFQEPRRGDGVVVTYPSGPQTYRVMAPGNEPPWRWEDPFHTIVRCHGKCTA